VQDGVIISHRGSVYAIGRGPGYYGIWVAAAPRSHPVEWWPETPDGWYSAWTRFAMFEAPDAIRQADEPADPSGAALSPAALSPTAVSPAALNTAVPSTPVPTGRRLIAPALLAAGVALGVAGLFPAYQSGTSLASLSYQLVPHAIYLAAWLLSAVLLLRQASLARTGALIGLGVSIVTCGLFCADAAMAITGESPGGAGLWISFIGWALCAGGSVAGLLAWKAGTPARPESREAMLALGLATLAALGAAAAFAPSWDSYTLRAPSQVLQTITAGNSFSNPALVIVSYVLTMLLLVAAVIIATTWRPANLGAALLAGVVIPLAGQAISAVVQITQKLPADFFAVFGVSPAQAARLGLTIGSDLTLAFWLFCAFVVALILLAARILTTPQPAVAAPPPSPVTYDTPPASSLTVG
jgi:hypothetical protein